MLTRLIEERLLGMRLRTMAETWIEQGKSADVVAMSFDERFALIVDAEWMARENAKLSRALKEAKLRIGGACVEGIEFPARRELDRAVVRQLASCKWVQEHQTVLVTGATGTGKTYVACALAQQACRKGMRAAYRRAPRFFDELRLARADGSYPRLLARIAKIDVLVLDSCGVPSYVESPVANGPMAGLVADDDSTYQVAVQRASSQASIVASLLHAAMLRSTFPIGRAFATAARFVSRSTAAYRFVVSTFAWPSQWLIVIMSTPACRRWTAVECRTTWGWILLVASVVADDEAIRAYLRRMYRTPKRVSGSPRWLRNSCPVDSASTRASTRNARSTLAVRGQSGQKRSLCPLPRSRSWNGRTS